MAVQRVFNYIWNHPGITRDVLAQHFNYDRSNILTIYLVRIRKGLASTDYRLIGTGHASQIRSYEIINVEHKTELVTAHVHL